MHVGSAAGRHCGRYQLVDAGRDGGPAGSAVGGPADSSRRFRVVSVSAVVRDQKGRFVRDLSQRDFMVAEAGRDKKILDFRSESDGPVKLGLLFDASGSMRVGGKTVDAQQAARHLLSALRGQGRRGDFFVRHAARSRQGLHGGHRVARGVARQDQHAVRPDVALRRDRRGSGDGGGARSGAREVAAAGGAGRADRRDRYEEPPDDGAKWRRSRARSTCPVYVIAVMSPIDDPQTDETPSFDVGGLRELARNTGGEMFTASAPAHASIAARQIVDELRHQYVLAFEASSGDGWRQLEVRARNPKHVVRARTGYSAGASGRTTQ